MLEQKTSNSKYDLEDRTYLFAKNVRSFIKCLKGTIANYEDAKQLIRSSASIAANYIEANDALSKKDFIYRIKLCRKESKESILFLKLVDINQNGSLDIQRGVLVKEATEIMKIFGSILKKVSL